jgi:glycosyltransferase involved in cell wall biosynthesis
VKLYVITVCLNAEPALRASVQSVNAVRTPDVFYLVKDGNSRDGTKKLLEESATLVDRWISESDDGIYDAMNKALSLLPLEEGHVIFLGAGDRLLQVPSITERVPAALLFGNVQIGNKVFISKFNWKLKAGNTLHHQGLFYPKAKLMQFRFDSRYKIYGDFDLNQRLMLAGIPFMPLNTTVAFAEPGGVSWGASESEIIAISRKNFGTFWSGFARIWARYRRLRARLIGTNW